MKKGEFLFPLYFVQHSETIFDFSFVVLLAFFPFIFSLSAGDVDADDASYRLKCIICNFTALDYHFLMTAAFASLLGVLGDGSHSVFFFSSSQLVFRTFIFRDRSGVLLKGHTTAPMCISVTKPRKNRNENLLSDSHNCHKTANFPGEKAPL